MRSRVSRDTEVVVPDIPDDIDEALYRWGGGLNARERFVAYNLYLVDEATGTVRYEAALVVVLDDRRRRKKIAEIDAAARWLASWVKIP